MKLLIDGDVILHRAAIAAEQTHVFGDTYTRVASAEEARSSADLMIQQAAAKYGADKVVLALSYRGEPWRRDILPTYKTHRGGAKPLGYWDLHRYVSENHPCQVWEPLEGDDVLGILATTLPPEDTLVLSIDKDLRTVPCRLTTGDGTVQEITETTAFHNLMLQVLTGDRSDGYSGLAGIGPVKARRLLEGIDSPVEMWDVVVDAYRDVGKTRLDALATARVAYILRKGDYDKKTKEVRLWEPPVN